MAPSPKRRTLSTPTAARRPGSPSGRTPTRAGRSSPRRFTSSCITARQSSRPEAWTFPSSPCHSGRRRIPAPSVPLSATFSTTTSRSRESPWPRSCAWPSPWSSPASQNDVGAVSLEVSLAGTHTSCSRLASMTRTRPATPSRLLSQSASKTAPSSASSLIFST